jgi:hypothetical protein
MDHLSRREFIASVATAAVVAGSQKTAISAADTTQPIADPHATLRWLEGVPPSITCATGTVAWPKGVLANSSALRITTESGEVVPSQSSPLAFWPDGSVKWTGHSVVCNGTPSSQYHVGPGEPVKPKQSIVIHDSADQIEIDTGIMRCTLPRSGSVLIDKSIRGSQTILSKAQLICQRQNQPDGGVVETLIGQVQTVAVESAGPVSSVIKIEGSHHDDSGNSFLPFVVRLYFSAGSDEIQVIHTFLFDGNEQKDFIRGIGLRFNVPMTDAMHDRHLRLVGDGHGLFAEAIRGITGLRRDPGEKVRKAQIDGLPTPPLDQWEPAVSGHLDLIPAWGDFTLSQLCADGFQIRKRTREGFGWIAAAAGHRSGGTGYVGGISGGVAFGIRDFWQKHPAQIDIRNAHSESAQVTMWLWAPDAPAMDLRFYHDGMGEETYARQNQGLDTTYEDYEPGYASPYGIGRTSEMKLKILSATPGRDALVQFADSVRTPPLLVCEPQRYLDAQVFGGLWTLPDRSTATKSLIEDQLAFLLDQYLKEIDQRSWYGFWDFGDVRHTYDFDRHVWRYDVGGFAWDNSELSTDLWLWYSFLRTGRADIFRMAEAMTRHTGEVDVYHIGPRKGLGTRHGVQHWGDSSKQTRISSALFRRPFYFLTGDERVGDLLRDQLFEDNTWLTNDVTRKLGRGPMKPGTRAAAHWGAMTWGELASAWLTEIERTRDAALRDKLLASMKTIAELPRGFFTQQATMNLETGVVTALEDGVEYEHLTAVFGLPEICAELVKTYGSEVPKFAEVWASYGELYNGSRAEREQKLGISTKSAGLIDAHSRCTAFAAWHRKDPALAARAWKEWSNGRTIAQRKSSMVALHIEGPAVLNPIDQANISTNETAQFSLATMQNLALIGEWVETVG